MKPVHGSSTHIASYDPHPTKAVGVHALSEIDIVAEKNKCYVQSRIFNIRLTNKCFVNKAWRAGRKLVTKE